MCQLFEWCGNVPLFSPGSPAQLGFSVSRFLLQHALKRNKTPRSSNPSIVTSGSKGRVLMRSTGSVEQPKSCSPALVNNQLIRLNVYLWLRWSVTLHLFPSLYAGDGTSTSPSSARESVHHSNVLACSPL